MADVGRPTKMDEMTIKKLEEAFAIGASDGEACFYADISKQTLYNYQKEHPEFVDRKEALKERPIMKARQEVVAGLNGNPEFALKYLERKRKKEFSLHQELDLTTKGESLNTLTDEQAERILQRRINGIPETSQ